MFATLNLNIEKTTKNIDKNLSDFSFEFEQLFYLIANQTKKIANGVEFLSKRIAFKLHEENNWLQVQLLAERLVDLMQSIFLIFRSKIIHFERK